MAAPGRDEDGVRRFVEHTAMTLADWGFPRMAARVLLALMSSEQGALAAADLARALEVSPAAISGAVRYLVHIGIVVREPSPGSRSDRYRLPDDAWYEASALKGDLFATIAGLAAEGVTALGGSSTPAGARVAEMRDFFAFVHSDLGRLLDRWRAVKATGPGAPEATS